MEHYVSQPSITKAIHSLEDELGVQLIRRTNTGIFFYLSWWAIHASCISHPRWRQTCRGRNERPCGYACKVTYHVRIQWCCSLASSPIFTEFVSSTGCRLSVHETTSENIIKHLLQEDIDLAYTIFPDHLPSKLLKTHLIRSELHLVMPKEHRLSHYSRVPIRELDGEPLLTHPQGALIRTVLDEKCTSYGVVPVIQYPSNQRAVILQLVSLGSGLTVTLVNSCGRNALEPNLVTRGFDDPIYFDEGIIHNTEHYLNKTAKTFIKFMKRKFLSQCS